MKLLFTQYVNLQMHSQHSDTTTLAVSSPADTGLVDGIQSELPCWITVPDMLCKAYVTCYGMRHVRCLTFGSRPLLRKTGKGSRPELASLVSRISQLPSSRK